MDADITQVLNAAARGEPAAADQAYATIYQELRRIARANRRRWHGNETLNTTALVHEAFVRLAGASDWANRVHFYATAARAIRHILIRYAESQQAQKRGGGISHVDTDVDDLALGDPRLVEEVLALDEALGVLEARNPRQARVVECRFFAGLSVEETAGALNVSPATVKRDWLLASSELHELLASPD